MTNKRLNIDDISDQIKEITRREKEMITNDLQELINLMGRRRSYSDLTSVGNVNRIGADSFNLDISPSTSQSDLSINDLLAIDLLSIGQDSFLAGTSGDNQCSFHHTLDLQEEIKNPTMPTYFTNRALCHLKLKRWDSSCQDCRKALDMDSSLVKGHFFLGQALLEMENYDEAIKHLQRANDLAKEQKLNFGDDIASQLRIARKKRWNVQEEKRITQEIELLTYVTKLIHEDATRQVEKVKHSMEDLNLEFVQDRIMEIEAKCENSISELNALFAKVDDRRRRRDVPDFLCGKISFEILREPVITPSGITYERKDIEEHLQRVGHFDPVTRVKLTQDQLIPNFAMKDVVDNFLQENEWALDY